jgi:uncharacterized membrane protein YccF (DUF307 family)
MNAVGNILWFVFGGFLSGLAWLCAGVIWCITIIGIPYGRQCFKFASMLFFPFGKDVEFGGGVPSTLVNIIGIPFGLQFFKIAKLSLMPFGAEVVRGY